MDKPRILIIEDDPDVNRLIRQSLAKENMDGIPAHDGLQAEQALRQEVFDLVILDLMLPGIDGLELLARIRSSLKVPVLILSAKSEETDKIIGLGLGADDYMTKPFSVNELKARVKAHLRRQRYDMEERPDPGQQPQSAIRHGNLELHPHAYLCTVDGVPCELTAKEFEILRLFLTHPKRIFTKAQIYGHIWKDAYLADENTVMVHIRRIRKKIEKNPAEPQIIQTVWGIGYRLGERTC